MKASRSIDQHAARDYDYVVLGAGPAGLQLGYFLARAGRDYVILDASDAPGAFFGRYPRHRKLLSINKVHTGYDDPELNLRWDWNSLLSDDNGVLLKDFSQRYFPDAADLQRYLARYAEQYALNVRYGTRIVRISRADGFRLLGEGGHEFRARRLVIATGLSRPYVPPISGIELAENYAEMSIDPADFTAQRVLIIGAGNSGFETANHLLETAARIHLVTPTKVQHAWKTHFPGHLRSVNMAYLDSFHLKSQNSVIGAFVERIERIDGEYVVTLASPHDRRDRGQLRYDRVLVCTGFRFDASLFDDSCRPELVVDGRFPRLTSTWESTSVEDLFFAGALMLSRDFKKAASSFIHGFRYNVKALHRVLEQRYHGASWPTRAVDATPGAVAELLLRRANRSSALWQQFGYLCDVVLLPDDGGPGRHLEELPVDHVSESADFRQSRCVMLTLEYGPRQLKPQSIFRDPELPNVPPIHFLHPVVRAFDGPRKTAELHLPDSITGEWEDEARHRRPLLELLAEVLGRSAGEALREVG